MTHILESTKFNHKSNINLPDQCSVISFRNQARIQGEQGVEDPLLKKGGQEYLLILSVNKTIVGPGCEILLHFSDEK